MFYHEKFINQELGYYISHILIFERQGFFSCCMSSFLCLQNKCIDALLMLYVSFYSTSDISLHFSTG